MKLREFYNKMNEVERDAFRALLDRESRAGIVEFWKALENLFRVQKHIVTRHQIEVWKKSFPALAFTPEKFRQICSELLEKIESFWIMSALKERIDNDWQLMLQILFPVFEIRGLGAYFTKKYRPKVSRTSKLGGDDLYFSFVPDREAYLERMRSQGLSTETDLDQLQISLQRGFLLQILKLMIEDQMTVEVYQKTPIQVDPLVESLISNAYEREIADCREDWLGHLYYQIHKMLKAGPNLEGMAKFEHVWSRYLLLQNDLQQIEIQSVLNIVQNYIIICINARRTKSDIALEEYKERLMRIYEVRMQMGLLLIDSELLKGDFKNIVSIYLERGYIDKAADFVEAYADSLKVSDKTSLLNFALARIDIARKLFEDALRRLALLNFGYGEQAMQDRLDTQSIEIKCLIELQRWEDAKNKIETSKKFLKEAKNLSETKKAPRRERLRLLPGLVSILQYAARHPRNRDELKLAGMVEKLKTEMGTERAVLDEAFFLRKIDEIRPLFSALP